MNYRPNAKFSLFANITYTLAEAGYAGIFPDPVSNEAQTALTHSDFDFSEVGDLSNLDIDILELTAGLDYMFSKNIGLNAMVRYYMYNDNDPVIWDKDGDMMLVWGGMKLVL